ncbi:MAG: AMP-binding protein [Desulfobacterales bacterium]|nr:AMP-binding protein [Desulfobacterales bacterium]
MIMEGITPYPDELVRKYREKKWWQSLTLADVFNQASDIFFQREALVDARQRLTYGQLRDRVDRFALALLKLGIRKASSVIIQLPNCAEWVIAYFACQKIGVAPVSALPRNSQVEIEHFCGLTNPVAWIVPDRLGKIEYLPLIEKIRPKYPQMKHVVILGETVPEGMLSFTDLLEMVGPETYPADYLEQFMPSPEDIVHFMPTGGTTGLPKLIPRTHECYVCNGYYANTALGLRNCESVEMINIPIAHNAAIIAQMVPVFMSGGKVVINPSTKARDILEWIAKERVDITLILPAQLAGILSEPDLSRYDLSSLKFLTYGAAHVPAELVKEARDRKLAPYCSNGFGMSEGPITKTRFKGPLEDVMYTVGTPSCPYDEYRIIDDDGKQLEPGEEGELAVRGPTVFSGYYKSEEENKKIFTPDGFFRTGDLAKFNRDGNLVITGRKKDVINRGGEMISAMQIEEMVITHPDVEDVAVIGMPDRVLGERICAYVKPKAGRTVTLGQIVTHLKDQGASVMLLPERVEPVDEMPLTLIGKQDKKTLRADIARKLQTEGQVF